MNLLSWLTRHPLKTPRGIDRAQYTAEVMAKIKAQESPVSAPARVWLPWPRLALTLATVAAGILIMMSVTHQAPRQFTQIAESPSSDDQWLDDTLQLLDELDEELVDDATADSSDEQEWLRELELLDESELASNS